LDGVAERDHQLSELLHTDEATGLPNRRAGRQQLGLWVRNNVTGAIIMLRIINLSGIRAVYGEAHANAVLYRYSRAVYDAAAQWADCIALYGEDVLMLLVPSGAKGAEAALSEIVDELMRTQLDEQESFERLARPELAASIALFPVHGDTVDSALGQASAALDAATARGAGAIERASEAGAGAMRSRLLRNQQIRSKLESEDLVLWFMPVVDVSTDPPRTCHIEALMRMRDEQGEVRPLPHELMEGLLSTPELLLPASERCFRYACDVVHSLHQEGYVLNMAFNLSASELRDEHLARLAQIFSESNVPFGALTLEITERAALRGFEKLVPRLQNMRERGVRVMLDDFGTGFSSMSHLVELPIDGLKIDRTFVRDLETDNRSREIVAATAALARVLHLEVIVEGVETPGQRDLLRDLGCHLHQGFLYSRAISAEQLRHWLDAERGDAQASSLSQPL
ncbi:MAG: EAL domain-containing protein, partial [Algiphilus sp.]